MQVVTVGNNALGELNDISGAGKHLEKHRHGIKILNPANFVEPSAASLSISESGLSTIGPAAATHDEVARRVAWFTDVTLHENVPEEIWQLFEVSKGAMVYGIFFYPLYTLGTEQLFRVFEHVVRSKYNALRQGKKAPSFKAIIHWLVNHGHLPGPNPERWLAAYDLRNAASHPTMQTIFLPADAIRTLRDMKSLIEHLYPPAAGELKH